MMASFTARLGGFDFSDYLRVGPGEGLDPTQSEFLTPEFADSPYDDGAGISSVGVANKQMAWPLYIKGGTKAGAIALEQQLNNIIRNVSPLVLEWKDTGLSDSTFWTVEFARFDRAFNKRQDDQGWAAGVLRIWARPYGDTGTDRLLASVLATAPNSPLVVATVSPGSVIGDVPALTKIRVGMSGVAPGPLGRIVGAAAIPAGYQSWTPAASLMISTATALVGASGAPGSQAVQIGATSGVVRFALAASPHAGRQRVFGVVRPRTMVGALAAGGDEVGAAIGPTAVVAGGRGFSIVDLGIAAVPTMNATSLYSITLSDRPQFASASVAITGPLQIAGVIVTPEDVSVVRDFGPPVAGQWFGGSAIPSTAFSGTTDDYGNTWQVVGSGAIGAGGGWMEPISTQVIGYLSRNVNAPFRLRTIGHVNAASASAVFMMGTTEGANNVSATFRCNSSGTSDLNLDAKVDGAVSNTGISLASSAKLVTGSSDVFVFDLVVGNTFAYANLFLPNQSTVEKSPATSVAVACAGVPLGAPLSGGQPWVRLDKFSGSSAIRAFTVHELPGAPAQASDSYLLDLPDHANLRTPAAGNSVDTSGRTLGADVKVTPSAAAIVAFDAQVEGGPMNDAMSVSVSVRERFTYARA